MEVDDTSISPYSIWRFRRPYLVYIRTTNFVFGVYTGRIHVSRLRQGVVRDLRPSNALEVGTFFGYSAIHIAQVLPPGAHLTCVEGKPSHAEVARACLKARRGSNPPLS